MRTFNGGDPLFGGADATGLFKDAMTGTCVLSGCDVTDGGTTDFDVEVASGTVTNDQSPVSVSAQTVSLNSSDNSDRFDTIYVDSTGTAKVSTGTAGSGTAPTRPSDTTVLAVVKVPANSSGVTNSDIQDSRSRLANMIVDGIRSQAIIVGKGGADIDGTSTLETVNAQTEYQAGGSTIAQSVAASGQASLSSGTAVVDTGLSATDATFYLALGIDDPGADAKVTGRLFWDDSAGTYKIELVEDGTSQNPTVNYDVVRVR